MHTNLNVNGYRDTSDHGATFAREAKPDPASVHVAANATDDAGAVKFHADHSATVTIGGRTHEYTAEEADRFVRRDSEAPSTAIDGTGPGPIEMDRSMKLLFGLDDGPRSESLGSLRSLDLRVGKSIESPGVDGIEAAPSVIASRMDKSGGPAIPVPDPGTTVITDNTLVVRPGGQVVRPAGSPVFTGLPTPIPDKNPTTMEQTGTAVEGALGGGLLTAGLIAWNPLLIVTGLGTIGWSIFNANNDLGTHSPNSYAPGDSVTGPGGSVWIKQEDGTWQNVDPDTGVITTNDYGDGDDPADYVQTIERPYVANGRGCTEVTTLGYEDNRPAGPPSFEYLDERGGACPVRPDGTLNPAAEPTSGSFRPGDSFVDANGDEWTKQRNGTFVNVDEATRTTRTVDYGDGDDPQDYTYTSEQTYDTEAGECTAVKEEEYVNGEIVSSSAEYLNPDESACPVLPDGSPNPDADPPPAAPRPPARGPGDDGWSGGEGSGAGGNGAGYTDDDGTPGTGNNGQVVGGI